MNSFTYNGVNSIDMGIRIESKNVFSAPEYDAKFTAIPGRDGELIVPQYRYSNVQVTYTVFVPAKTLSSLAEKLTAIKAWLYAEPDRYHELYDTYDDRFFRRAAMKSQLEIEDQLNKIGTFTVSFSCHPFRFSWDGQIPIRLQSGSVLSNPFAFPAKPVIKVCGSDNGSLRITNGDTKIWTLEGFSDGMVIDSNLMNCYKDALPLNDHVSGDGFPILYPGDSTIFFDGGITAVEITPGWCTL